MGWGDCGTDSKGRPIGYDFEAVCDHGSCKTIIHRGLDYACGGMHGEGTVSCEGYFCSAHKLNFAKIGDDELAICDDCAAMLAADEGWHEDEEEGIWRQTEEA